MQVVVCTRFLRHSVVVSFLHTCAVELLYKCNITLAAMAVYGCILAHCDYLPIYRYTVISHCNSCDIAHMNLALCIGCWLDGGRSECKLAVNCKKHAGFKWTKCLKKVWQTSPERNLTFHIKICMSELLTIRSITSINPPPPKKKTRQGGFYLHADLNSMTDWFRQVMLDQV